MVRRNAPPSARIDGSWKSRMERRRRGGDVTGGVRWPIRDWFGRDGANPLTRLARQNQAGFEALFGLGPWPPSPSRHSAIFEIPGWRVG